MKGPAGCRRVLMLVENGSYPEDIRVFHEATALTDAGYLVSVICPSTSAGPWQETVSGVHVFRYPAPSPGRGLITYVWEYGVSLLCTFILSIIVLLTHGFDYIHAANPPDTAFLIAAFYRLLGKRFIFDHHDLSPELYQVKFGAARGTRGLVHRILLVFERLSCRAAARVIATNESYRSIEMTRDGVPADRIAVVRNGPDLSKKRSTGAVEDFHRSGKTNLLYLGVIGFQDGVDCLLRSLHILSHELGRTDFVCVIAGNGAALPSVKLQAIELGLESCVSFPGWIQKSKVASYISAADICLAPEPSNPLNDSSTFIKIAEYLSFGKPVVAFDLLETRVTAGGAALYASRNSEHDFAEKVATLLDNPQVCTEMGLLGIQRVETQLAWEHQKRNLLEVYEALDAASSPR